ncbi:MAG: hypothetical protein RL538_646 [Candidatus Parcubacteria bacterium]|jgi:voltage-gated potassium channel
MKKKIKKTKSVDVFDNPNNPYFVAANSVLAIMTLVSVAAIALETVTGLNEKYHLVFRGIEWLAVVLFSAEYIVRLITTKKPFRYVLSFFGIIDLVAILPSLLGMTNLTFLKSVRTVRIIRLLRMLRLAKFTRGKKKDSDSKSLQKINLEIYFLSLTLAVLVLGSLFYTFEHHHATNIPEGMYWALKSILGGFPYPQPETLGGIITLILARFTSMILLGMMLSLIGTMLRKLLTGSETD